MMRNRYDRLAIRTMRSSKGKRSIARFGSVDYEDVARRPGADAGIRSIVTQGSNPNFEPAGVALWLDDIATYKRFAFNMNPMTNLATLQLAATMTDGTPAPTTV